MGAVFAGHRTSTCRPRRGRAWASTRRCCASARTAPTGASTSRSSTSPRRCAAASSRSSSRSSAAAARCARSTPAGARCRARSSRGSTRSSSATAARRWRGASSRTARMRSPIAKFLGEDRVAAAVGELRASEGDLLLFVADHPRVAAEALGALRLELGRRFGLIPEGGHDVLWVVDFPMFEPTDDGWGAVHHPFTAPTGDFADPGAMRSRGVRPDRRRLGARRRLDPHQHARGPGAGLQGHRHERGGGPAALRLPARRAEVRRPAARRHRAGHRPRRGPASPAATRSATSSPSPRRPPAATR